MFIFLVVATVVLAILIVKLVDRHEKELKNLPPGFHSIWDLLLFSIPKLGLPNYILCEFAAKIHGPIFSARLPNLIAVVINDLKIARQVMSSPDLVNRLPSDHILYEGTFKKPLGLLFSNDEYWRQSRRFSIKTLHDLGFHRQRDMETFIRIEAEQLDQRIQMVLDDTGKGILSPHLLFELHSLNIIWTMIAGKRFDNDDPQIEMLLNCFKHFNREFNVGATPVDFAPWLRHIPGLTVHDSWVQGHLVFQEFFQKIISKRREDNRYGEEPVDLIDHFLQEIDKHTGEEPNYFTDESFISIMTDMFLGGSDTTSSTLEFAILHMALNPEIQKKVQAEIDQVIGSDRFPTYPDKINMIYTQTVLLEILRYASAIPVASRSSLKDTTIGDYTIPAGAVITVNIHGIHFSDELWQDPWQFQPERFLSPEGKIINAEKIIPFGLGKRSCIGEAVARISLFIFFTCLIQKYEFSLSPQHPRPSMKNLCGLTRCPMPYHVAVSQRLF